MTKCEELAERMDEAARRFAETHDERFKREIENLSWQVADLRALAVLEAAVDRCHDEDVRTLDVRAALDYFSKRVSMKWPIEQFRAALAIENFDGRWRNLNVTLNRIKLSVEGRDA